ncbi:MULTISPECIES: S8 family serine peptidase [Spirosoma]|uniref:Peptidase S8/S53 domain-containing protein n=1 Tax=Spirosoma sordidisoli TaxID=2502893 RepID=A0A4Q2UV44_9BACT|nr:MULTISPECIES: S8 family serine peptidase [Spirosoma]RYC70789.1 hypothetical protein EQG79_01155 [Spirosoma sordidisoli]
MSHSQEKPMLNPGRPNFHVKVKRLYEKGELVPDTVPDEIDPRRLVVRNQLVALFEKPLEVDQEKTLSLVGVGGRDKREVVISEARVIKRSHCNPNLVLLEGNNAHLLTEDIKITSGPTLDIVKSSANDVHYSEGGTITPPPKILDSSGPGNPNPPRIKPALFDFQLRRIIRDSSAWQDFPIVGIMDTGIDFSYPNTESIPIQFNGGKPLCRKTIEPDFIGWDFVHDQNYPYDDNDRSKHGSRIAAIISRQMEHKVRILPLKVIDKYGIGQLFDILCCFEYLLHSDSLPQKPVAINASWGFYQSTEDKLLSSYIPRLQDAGIWLVNAAGNEGDVKNNKTVDLGDERRWPSCYSDQFASVVTVTTVKRTPLLGFETVENFSKRFVNMGIGSGNDGKFIEPLVSEDNSPPVTFPPVKGSSFATPFAVAQIVKCNQRPTTIPERLRMLTSIPGRITALTERIDQGTVVPVETN